jgi:hypothetical protein
MTDQVEEFADEEDDYDRMLAALGRSKDDDCRVSHHEAGHVVAARLLGQPLGGATINPDPNGKFGGLVWGPRHRAAFGSDDAPLGSSADAAPALCDKLRDLMPQDGEPRDDVADIYSHVLTRCTELAAGAVAEKMLLPGEPVPSVSDVEQAVGPASLVCKSAEAVGHFLAFAERQAFDLLYPHGPVIIALSVVLKIRRTLTGKEIDDLIANTCAGFELAAEHRRRADWRKRELAANSFQIECGHVNVASLPRPAPDRVG